MPWDRVGGQGRRCADDSDGGGMTSGRASYTMEFSHYEPVPRNVQDEIVAGKQKAA